jgi:hypothetical protein
LRENQAVKSLAFLAVTHPHADHCTGLKDLLEAFPAQRFWIFDTYQEKTFWELIDRLYRKGARDKVEEDLRLKPGTLTAQLVFLDKQVTKALKTSDQTKFGRFNYLRPTESLSLCDEEVTVRFLTPGDLALKKYRGQLLENLSRLVDDGQRLSPGWKLTSLNPNLISGSLLLEYGVTRILLMGDAEEPLWREHLALDRSRAGGAVQLVKISHHGSTNGYVNELYEKMCPQGSSVGIVTPFDRHRFPLPTREGIGDVRKHLSEVFCTNRIAAEDSSKLVWEPVAQAGPPVGELPAKLAGLLVRNLGWVAFLAPEVGGPETPPADKTFPAELAAAIAEDPSLLPFVHPVFRNRHVGGSRLDLAKEFRASFYFGKDGKEDISRRYLGSGTGKLRAG